MAPTQQHLCSVIRRLVKLYREILNMYLLSQLIISRMLVNKNLFIHSDILSNRKIIRLYAFFKTVK